jgi:hypothetical protein
MPSRTGSRAVHVKRQGGETAVREGHTFSPSVTSPGRLARRSRRYTAARMATCKAQGATTELVAHCKALTRAVLQCCVPQTALPRGVLLGTFEQAPAHLIPVPQLDAYSLLVCTVAARCCWRAREVYQPVSVAVHSAAAAGAARARAA